MVFFIELLLFILLAGIVALIVWFLASNLFWAGVAFVVAAVLSLLRR